MKLLRTKKSKQAPKKTSSPQKKHIALPINSINKAAPSLYKISAPHSIKTDTSAGHRARTQTTLHNKRAIRPPANTHSALSPLNLQDPGPPLPGRSIMNIGAAYLAGVCRSSGRVRWAAERSHFRSSQGYTRDSRTCSPLPGMLKIPLHRAVLSRDAAASTFLDCPPSLARSRRDGDRARELWVIDTFFDLRLVGFCLSLV